MSHWEPIPTKKEDGSSVVYRCKHCHVPVVSKTNKRAQMGFVHAKKCPRRFL